MKIYEEIRNGSPTVLCPECREPNPVADEKCFSCGAELVKPAALWENARDVLIRPMVGMRRVAATYPYVQGIFLFIGLIAIVTLLQAFSILSWGQNVVNGNLKLSRYQTSQIINAREGQIPLSSTQQDALSKSAKPELLLTEAQKNELGDKDDLATRLTDAQYVFLRDNPTAEAKLSDKQVSAYNTKGDVLPTIDSSFIVPFLLNTLIRVAFSAVFALAVSVTARLFFKQMAKTNFYSLFAVATFAQLAMLITIFLLLLAVFVPELGRVRYDPSTEDQTNPYLLLSTYGTLIYQVSLLVIGVRFSTLLNWQRSLVVVLIPALLLVFFLQLPF